MGKYEFSEKKKKERVRETKRGARSFYGQREGSEAVVLAPKFHWFGQQRLFFPPLVFGVWNFLF